MRPPLYHPARLVAQLDRDGMDAFLVATPPNVLYATRYRKGGAAMAFVSRDRPTEPVLILPASDVDFLLEDLADGVEAAAFGSFFRFRDDHAELRDGESLVARVHAETRRHADRFGLAAELLRARGLASARLGTDVPVALLAPLAELLPEATFVAAPDALRRLRMVKTDEELARLRRCVEVAEAAISATVAAASPGVTQRELARVFNEAVAARSARTRLDNVSVGTSTALGNVNVPDDVLRAGDVIRFDVGATLEGYCSDLSRCFVLEPVAPKAAAYHRALVAGQQAALDVLRADVEARELFSVAVDAVRDAGILHYERTNVGHGIGIAGDGYDAPLLAPDDETALEPGMVLCVETPYYELGFAGLQVEDMVVVRESGYETLSELPRELAALG
jgi:Xaa-Pro aminopeptidase